MKLRSRHVDTSCKSATCTKKILRNRRVVVCCLNCRPRKDDPYLRGFAQNYEEKLEKCTDDSTCDLAQKAEVAQDHTKCVLPPVLEYLEISNDTLEFLQTLGTPPDVERPILPQDKTKDITLVLDLDETLVHSSLSPMDSFLEGKDIQIGINIPGGGERTVYVRRRPYLTEFLQLASRYFEVVVFTASPTHYANKVIDLVVDPTQELIHYRLFRDHCHLHRACTCPCHPHRAHYVKNLCGLGRDLSKVVMIDNEVECFGFQLPNGVLIEPFWGSPEDTSLVDMAKFLGMLQMNMKTDVRESVKQYYQQL